MEQNDLALDSLTTNPTSLIPESLIVALTIGFIVINVAVILISILYVINLVRQWKVQSATFAMQRDIAAIKKQLESSTFPDRPPAAKLVATSETDDAVTHVTD